MEDYIKRMKEIAECTEYDAEFGHNLADDLLVEILNKHGYQEVTEIFNNMTKWYA